MARLRNSRNTSENPTNNSSTPVLTPTVSYDPTPAPASVLGPPKRYTNENLLRTTKLALELVVKGQKHDQLQANFASHEQPLKAWFPDLYYRNSHLNCYCFCQQSEDYFETAEANRPN